MTDPVSSQPKFVKVWEDGPNVIWVNPNLIVSIKVSSEQVLIAYHMSDGTTIYGNLVVNAQGDVIQPT